MSDFTCSVERLKISAHPNADAIELANVGDFQCIVRKGDFKDGDLGVYIPEQAIVPDWLLQKMGLFGKLSGSGKNRVKAIKLRGVLSQGLVYATDTAVPELGNVLMGESPDEFNPKEIIVNEGDDVAEFLGIVKYEPKIPQQMMGRMAGVDLNATTKYDFDNIKKQPDLFEEGEEVILTEKIHGTLLCVGVVPDSMMNERFYKSRVVVSSKGMGAKGWILDVGTGETGTGLGVHVDAAISHGLLDKMYDLAPVANSEGKPILLFGEVFGETVQDLGYSSGKLEFRAFDMCCGVREQAEYAPVDPFLELMAEMDIKTVPMLYRGPYSKAVVERHTSGLETVSGEAKHIREGVVVRSVLEQPHPKYGRKVAKSVSEAYLLRKGGTEFN